MRFKKILLILIIIAGLFITGCGGGDGDATTPSESPYLGGSKGIMADFEPFGVEQDGFPTIYDDETFPVEVTVKNKGEEDVAAGAVMITLKGISPSDFSGISFSKTNAEEIESKSDLNPDGGEETIDFGDADYQIVLQTSYYDVDVFANVDYPYKSHVAVPKVCFNRDVVDESVCVVDEVKDHFSSGAPIRITRVEERRAGSGLIALEYTIENVGGGDATKPGEEFDNRYDQVTFSLDSTSNPNDWECKLGGSVNEGRLVDGKGTILCKLINPIPDGEMYTKQIDLTVSYDYRELIQQSVRIKSTE